MRLEPWDLAAGTFSQMLSQVRKFGLHLILANQSIAQFNPGLQTALGNAQTIISFRISWADADVLARVLGEVDIEAVKRENQTEVQHPVFSPLFEQWEEFIQHLTRQPVRQATVKTADDRLAVIWLEKVRNWECGDGLLEEIIKTYLKKDGSPFESINQQLTKEPLDSQGLGFFSL